MHAFTLKYTLKDFCIFKNIHNVRLCTYIYSKNYNKTYADFGNLNGPMIQLCHLYSAFLRLVSMSQQNLADIRINFSNEVKL